MFKKYLLISGLFLTLVTCKKDCPPDFSLTNQDIAGFFDSDNHALFTTTSEKEAVLAQLDAEIYNEHLYKIPVFELGGNMVYLLFNVYEVESPGNFIDFKAQEVCYDDILQDYYRDLLDIIERNPENLEDEFVFACGDATGKLDDRKKQKELDKAKEMSGDKDEAFKKLSDQIKKSKEAKKDLSKKAKEAGKKAKEKLANNDKDGARKEAKKLIKETELKYVEFEVCPETGMIILKDKFYYDHYWTQSDPDTATFLREFMKQGIRYKVYRDATCSPGPPTIDFQCFEFNNLDTINPGPRRWTTQNSLPRNICTKGTSFCVEQEIIIRRDDIYSDANCTQLIESRNIKGFGCF